MNNYETFKDDLILQISERLPDIPVGTVNQILEVIDLVALKYNIERQTMDLTVQDRGFPLLAKMFIASKAVEQKSQGTLKNYKYTLSNFFDTVRKPVDQVTTNDLRVYLHQYQVEHSVTGDTLETIRHVFNSFFSWCYAEEYIPKDPTKRLQMIKTNPGVRQFLEPIELEMVRNACQNPREKAIIDFLFSTGCRVSEMCAVKKENVDIQARTVFIEHGKGDKSRTTFLNPESVISLTEYLKTRKDDSPYLFTHIRHPTGSDGRLEKKTIQMLLRQIASRVPSLDKKLTPHVLRHTAATIALRNGMPMEQVKEFLGHSNINTTMIYAKLDKADIKRSHEKYLG